jgi:curved DNA-binding protein CbpA
MQPRFFPYAPERDVYRLLEVDAAADPDAINSAVRRLARAFHPDRNGSPRATQEMQVVNAVRNLLIDPESRAVYDRARHRFLAESAARQARRVTRLGARAATPAPATPLPASALPASSVAASVLSLTGQALLAALRALLDAFRPRCSVCWAVAEFNHHYCAACGAPLGRPQPLAGR